MDAFQENEFELNPSNSSNPPQEAENNQSPMIVVQSQDKTIEARFRSVSRVGTPSFLSQEERERQLVSIRQKLRALFTPVSMVNGRIHCKKSAMIPGHEYEMEYEGAKYQAVRRLDDAIVIYEVAPE